VAPSPGLLALFFVLLMAQFGVRTVQPAVTLFVQELVGRSARPRDAERHRFLDHRACQCRSHPISRNKSDKIGYRRVLMVALLGAGLTTLAQAFTDNYWTFVAQRFAVGLFIGGILPMASALVGRLVPRAARGTVYGITASAMFLSNSIGPLSGGAVAAARGVRWVFLVTAAVLLANLLWVYCRVPEYADRES
jgi:MFS transporter, DHA1 family, multidrug resistance protein